MRLRCISLWQPWAQWVALGWKSIETRTHPRLRSLVGQRIGIHATRKVDRSALFAAERWLTDAQFEKTTHFPETSGIICTVKVIDFRALTPADESQAFIECATARFGLFLSDPHEFKLPHIRGRQGIFTIEV